MVGCMNCETTVEQLSAALEEFKATLVEYKDYATAAVTRLDQHITQGDAKYVQMLELQEGLSTRHDDVLARLNKSTAALIAHDEGYRALHGEVKLLRESSIEARKGLEHASQLCKDMIAHLNSFHEIASAFNLAERLKPLPAWKEPKE